VRRQAVLRPGRPQGKDNRDDVTIVRIEQLAPLPNRRLANTLDGYPNAVLLGAGGTEPGRVADLRPHCRNCRAPDRLKRISRRAMSAPSSGSSKVHAVEQQQIIDEAFG
jgi:2-oxoglutarate decarboxylase